MNSEIILGLVILLVVLLILKISKSFFKLVFAISLGLLAFLVISGCSGGDRVNIGKNLEKVEENTLTRISDIPFLQSSKINIESSLIMGEGKSWSGQLLVLVPEKKIDVFNYYVKNLGEFGWKEQTTIRGETSILNFVGENNRVAIITIEEGRFGSSEVLISVSPYTEDFEEKVGDYINEKYLEITGEN
tara:strand:+ start:66 stop:632 length:567 start_codon:yes stop_codon:yes gene_type:complete